MTDLTFGQLAAGLAILVTFIASIQNLKTNIKRWAEALLKPRFDSIDDQNKKILDRIDDVEKKISKVDMENCKNYLVTFLSEIRRGETKDQIEYQRFWEEYDHYIANGGNSYVKEDVADLKSKGLLSGRK